MTDSTDHLARTRLAIIEDIHRRQSKPLRRRAAPEPRPEPDAPAARAADEAARHAAPAVAARWAGVREAGRSYWEHHPMRTAVTLAEPALSAYGRRHPFRFLALSAAAGALLVVARPWRMVSVTGLLLAALKSPQVAGLVMNGLVAGRDAGTSAAEGESEP